MDALIGLTICWAHSLLLPAVIRVCANHIEGRSSEDSAYLELPVDISFHSGSESVILLNVQ